MLQNINFFSIPFLSVNAWNLGSIPFLNEFEHLACDPKLGSYSRAPGDVLVEIGSRSDVQIRFGSIGERLT